MNAFYQYLYRLAIAFDRLLNVLLFGGNPDQTISYHAALAQEQSRRWGCWLCWYLSHTVEPSHCLRQLINTTEKPAAALRAGFQLLVIGLVCWGLSVLALFAAR